MSCFVTLLQWEAIEIYTPKAYSTHEYHGTINNIFNDYYLNTLNHYFDINETDASNHYHQAFKHNNF